MDHTFDFSSPGSSGDPETSAARLNSRSIRSTIAASARTYPDSFAEQDALYSSIRIETRLWRLPLHDDANETCTLRVSLLDSLSDRRLQTLARNRTAVVRRFLPMPGQNDVRREMINL
jgi:hypothetical protein